EEQSSGTQARTGYSETDLMAREQAMSDGTLIAVPEDILKDDLLESYWFIDSDGFAIIEIPPTGDPGKAIAYFYQITQKIESKTVTNEKQRREVIVFPKFQLDRLFYRQWPSDEQADMFIVNEDMAAVMEKHGKSTLTKLKSN